MEKPKFETLNIITSINFHTKFDLDKIHSILPKTTYDPEQFPALFYRPSERNNIEVLLFKSGKAVCHGAKRQQEAAMVANTLRKKLKEAGFNLTWWHDSKVESIHALGKLDSPLDLNQVRLKLGATLFFKTLEKLRERDIKILIPDSVSFPCVLHVMKDPKAQFLLFGSGKYIIFGTKSEEQMSEAHTKLSDRLHEQQLI